MALVLHIIIAISTVLLTAVAYLFPTQSKINISSLLIVLTVLSGSYLVVTTPSYLVHACISGLLFVGVSIFGIIAAKNRLNHSTELLRK
jgi:hypothetical protein